MAEKRIASIECEIPGGMSEYISIDSDASLLDWDIIFIRPNIFSLKGNYGLYKGMPSLSDNQSFQLMKRMDHWNREITDAVNSGKTVIVFLSDFDEVYIDSGRREYSGTGRNRQTTRIVTEYNNYKCLPFDLKLVNSKGTSMRLAKGAEILGNFWSEFGKDSSYNVKIEKEVSKPLVVTTSGTKTVGALIRIKGASGAILLLPYLDIDSEEFYSEAKDGTQEWTKKQRLRCQTYTLDKVKSVVLTPCTF